MRDLVCMHPREEVRTGPGSRLKSVWARNSITLRPRVPHGGAQVLRRVYSLKFHRIGEQATRVSQKGVL